MITYIFRALPLKRDSRTQRYKSFFKGEIKINTWEETYYNPKNGIEKLKISRSRVKKIFSYPLYLLYLFLFSLLNIKNNDRVICMDLDTFIPIFLGSFWKNTTIYFDIVDPIAQTKFRNIYGKKLFDYIEYFLIKYRSHTIIPNENRLTYYENSINKNLKKCKVLIIENVPQLSKLNNINRNHVNKYFTIGYFGTLDESRGLIELIDFVSGDNDITLLIAGMGPLKDFVSKKAKDNKNIKFFGSFTIDELTSLYHQVKFSWSYYTPKIFLHKYASPNKYYEHLAFKTPMIINEFVPLSSNIKNMKSGIVIEDNLNNSTFFDMKNYIGNYDYNINNFLEWEKKYENYQVDFESYEKNILNNN